MASWQEISDEITRQRQTEGPTGIDTVRRNKLANLFNITQRPVLMYGVDMFNTHKIHAAQGDISISLNDKEGFIEALRGISGNEIDIILHSPGGSPEATESLVELLRKRFDSIRFIIPSIAKSAATMLAMSGNEIILGNDAELGPTDPQMIINGAPHAAHRILKQFDLAKKEIAKDNKNLPAWLPIIQQYGPSLLVSCNSAINLTKKLVAKWLGIYMLKGIRNGKRKAATISRFLAQDHLSHGRLIDISELKSRGVNIKLASELSPDISDALQDIHYALIMTFESTGAYKIYENHLGKGFYRVLQVIVANTPEQPTQSN